MDKVFLKPITSRPLEDEQDYLITNEHEQKMTAFAEHLAQNPHASCIIRGHLGVGKTSFLSQALYKTGLILSKQFRIMLLCPLNLAGSQERIPQRLIIEFAQTLRRSNIYSHLDERLKKRLIEAEIRATCTLQHTFGNNIKYGGGVSVAAGVQFEEAGTLGAKVGFNPIGEFGAEWSTKQVNEIKASISTDQVIAYDNTFRAEYPVYNDGEAAQALTRLIDEISRVRTIINYDSVENLVSLTAQPISIIKQFLLEIDKSLSQAKGCGCLISVPYNIPRNFILSFVSRFQKPVSNAVQYSQRVTSQAISKWSLQPIFILEGLDRVENLSSTILNPLRTLMNDKSAMFIVVSSDDFDLDRGMAYRYSREEYLSLYTPSQLREVARLITEENSSPISEPFLAHLILKSYGIPSRFFGELENLSISRTFKKEQRVLDSEKVKRLDLVTPQIILAYIDELFSPIENESHLDPIIKDYLLGCLYRWTNIIMRTIKFRKCDVLDPAVRYPAHSLPLFEEFIKRLQDDRLIHHETIVNGEQVYHFYNPKKTKP